MRPNYPHFSESEQPSGISLSMMCFVSMKILIASINAPGHLNPLLGVARILVSQGHEVLVQTGMSMKPIVEAAGLPFTPSLPEADTGAPEYFAKYPERQQKLPCIEMFDFDIEHFFVPQLPAQTAGLERRSDTSRRYHPSAGAGTLAD
jgi:hypothetical protein